jgi:hypothetical protein
MNQLAVLIPAIKDGLENACPRCLWRAERPALTITASATR